MRRLVAAGVAIALLCAVAVGYTLYAVRRSDAAHQGRTLGVVAGRPDLAAGGAPRLAFKNTRSGSANGDLATTALAEARGGVRQVADQRCERVYAAGATVLCLAARGGAIASYVALVLDPALGQRARIALEGAPSRARLSADGRLAAWTVFVTGDSYAGTAFSTRTSIYDTRTGGYVDSLESFTAYLNGAVYRQTDVNYWGVTFAADDDTFYATLGSQGRTYLVRGSLSRRAVWAVASNVECPSLSPDGTRLVYKKRVSDDPRAPWRFYLMNLAPIRPLTPSQLAAGHLLDGQLTERPLAETRSVDDQAAWLDAHTVMYGVPTADGAGSDVWSVPADGSGRPTLLVSGASSPVRLG
jgi:hypothetical protein